MTAIDFRIELILSDIGTMLRRERLQANLSQQVVGKDDWILSLGPANAVSIADYVKRGNHPRLRAAKSVKGHVSCTVR